MKLTQIIAMSVGLLAGGCATKDSYGLILSKSKSNTQKTGTIEQVEIYADSSPQADVWTVYKNEQRVGFYVEKQYGISLLESASGPIEATNIPELFDGNTRNGPSKAAELGYTIKKRNH